jgi:hypothetical protein
MIELLGRIKHLASQRMKDTPNKNTIKKFLNRGVNRFTAE